MRWHLLFPSLQNLQKSRSGEFSINGTTDLRTCRRTFGQNCLDKGVPLDSTSRMMGHATSKTTETYYAHKKNEQAVAEAQRVWTVATPPNTSSQTQPASNPLIGKIE